MSARLDDAAIGPSHGLGIAQPKPRNLLSPEIAGNTADARRPISVAPMSGRFAGGAAII